VRTVRDRLFDLLDQRTLAGREERSEREAAGLAFGFAFPRGTDHALRLFLDARLGSLPLDALEIGEIGSVLRRRRDDVVFGRSLPDPDAGDDLRLLGLLGR